jgi:hypothetical protein
MVASEGTSSANDIAYIVSPTGVSCLGQVLYCENNPLSIQQLPASSDYDVSLSVTSNGSSVSGSTNLGPGLNSGFFGGYPTGLIEITAAGSSDAAYFSNYQMYQYK